MTRPILHGYFRSSTSIRTRMALNLKGIEYDQVTHHLRKGEQKDEAYLKVNPQGLVPALVWTDGQVIPQSMAIMEFLDEVVPQPPLLPADAGGRARVRSLTQMICCDIHPLNNMRVLKAIGTRFGADDEATAAWFRYWVAETFRPLEQMLAHSDQTGRFCHGDEITMADLALVSQIINNRRFDVPMAAYPTLQRIADACLEVPAIERALPQHQPDAE
ncbi:maleylacetoacetate isomerase [Natronospirillum operosum]|uniref:Maleylacetoacetate isomerase n=1 Tax=Natronospirillum operosum TaxID=2759953 RepID=A0A4Z0WAG8_9GAMM|nr:maleylacetoacetate isomerase [Natronospirillum operosum]TGG93355.1 maleylacetoacetate isomerase [Natronospirillum operosum]